MIRKPVSSSNLKSVGYEEETQILEIEFNNGGVYRYFEVPKTVYFELMSASSHGKYFNQYIKNCYHWSQVC